MTTFTISPAGSVSTFGAGQHAFQRGTTGPDGLVVQAGAFLTAAGTGAAGALLSGVGAWTAHVDGSIVSAKSTGLAVSTGNTGLSTVVVGTEGSIGGKTGLAAYSAVDILNAGTIAGQDGWAIHLAGSSTHKVTNAGTLEGSIVASPTQASSETVINSGLVIGELFLGAGSDSFTNLRTVDGAVLSGTVRGVIRMGDGNDRLLGGARGETVMDGNGADTVSLGGGNDLYLAIGANGSDGSDTVAGGSGTDLYDASLASKAVLINLDTVAHDVSPLVVGAFRVAAGRALGIELAGATANDLISGFEDADGGQGDDVIYGSGAANVLQGLNGHDTLMGYGSSDRLDGGDGNDTLVGGAQQDRLSGGAGADIFSFVKASDSGNTSATRDVIRDFQDGFDRIDLRFVDAKVGTAADEAFAFIGTNVAWGGQAGQLRAVWTSGGQIVQGDTNGDRVADFSVMVREATPFLELGASDFLL